MSSSAPPSPSTAPQEQIDSHGKSDIAENDDTGVKPSQIEPWCISVKTVGGGFERTTQSTSPSPSSSGERLFNVTVSPEDGLASLHQEIEGATGVKASQQRLIYRGRLIGTNQIDNSPQNNHGSPRHKGSTGNDDNYGDSNGSQSIRKIKDIVGLCDGQTIHLVKKRETEAAATGSNDDGNNNIEASTNGSRGANSQSSSTEDDNFGSGGGGGALLAALLGLGLSNSSSTPTTHGGRGDENARLSASNANGTLASSWRSPSSNTTTTTTSGAASSRLGGSSHRRPHYRLSAEDLELPDPGSLEPVRQGIMTLHTLLPHSELYSQEGMSPLEANREWFRGQWCDVRDTVNQWLEATVVQILQPHEVLPETVRARFAAALMGENPSDRRRRPAQVDNDPAVHSNDLEGRRRLLIEPCEPGDPEELSGDLVGYRPRRNNDGVQLLLIHYNGWPHRWDEWIRSDSDRIRPFRTRTRHPNSSSTASPSPQSVFIEAPRTNIRAGDDEEDREALLPELARVLSQANTLLQELARRGQPETSVGEDNEYYRVDADLPWLSSNENLETGIDEMVPNSDYTAIDNASVAHGEVGALSPSRYNIITPVDTDDDDDDDEQGDPAQRSNYTPQELRNLATVLDRLGRTLTDAAPHVASLAASLPDDSIAASSTPEVTADVSRTESTEPDQPSAPLGGLLSLWSRERRWQTSTDNNSSSGEDARSASQVDPDHVDYANGLVNTTRGEVRSGPRTRATSDELTNLLGAYLAAASLGSLANGDAAAEGTGTGGLGTLFRSAGTGIGGTGGGELAITIHAVVTAPGAAGSGDFGGTGATAFGGADTTGTTAATAPLAGTRNLFSSVRRSGRSSLLRSRTSQSPNTGLNDDDDDEDLFSELYSENPESIDPNGSPESANRLTTPNSPDRSRGDGTRSSIFAEAIPDNSGEASTRTLPQRRRLSRSSSRRQQGERRSGVFRLFRRRGPNQQN